MTLMRIANKRSHRDRHPCPATRRHRDDCCLAAVAWLLLAAVPPFMHVDASRADEQKSPAQQGRMETAPIAEYQTALAELGAVTSRADFAARMDRLLAMDGPDRKVVVGQVLQFGARNPKDEKAASVVGRIVRRLSESKDALVAAVVPHLDNTDPGMQKAAQQVLAELEGRTPSRPADLSIYYALIESAIRAGNRPQDSLVMYMYEADPGQALLLMMRAHQLRQPEELRPILWAEHTVSDLLWQRRFGFIERNATTPAAKAEIEKMSTSRHWWARMYAAEMIGQYPELGDEGLTKRLTEDADPLVRKALMRKSVS